jgi:transposase
MNEIIVADLDLLLDLQESITTPARSSLFSLAPEGVGTPGQEGLLSLLVRTCNAHAVNPRLVIRDIFPEAEPSIGNLPTAAFYQRLAGTMNGLSKYAELFVAAMEKLTGRSDLQSLTMLPWQDLLPHNGQGLLARHRRWCPVCLHEQRLRGDVATLPLIWSLETCSICNHHSVSLEHCCPSCEKTQPFVPPYPDLGICSHCRHPLSGVRAPQEISGFHRWITEAVGGMVERQSSEGFSPSLLRFRQFLIEQVEAHTEGNRAAFCRALGLNEFAISGWLNKGERPSITQFLTICYGTKTIPVAVFGDSQSPTEISSLCSPAQKIRTRRACPRLDSSHQAELQQTVQSILAIGDGQSVSAIANEVGVGRTYLRYWFPDLSKSLSLQSRAVAQRKSENRHKEQQRSVRKAIRRIAESGGQVSYRRVAKVLKHENLSLSEEHLRDAYRDELDAILRAKT